LNENLVQRAPHPAPAAPGTDSPPRLDSPTLTAMHSGAKSVAQYLASLPADRRAAISAVRDVIRANLDADYEEGMRYGMIGYAVPHRIFPPGYHTDPSQPLFFAALASQKNHLMGVYCGCAEGPGGETRAATKSAGRSVRSPKKTTPARPRNPAKKGPTKRK
jgi:hypothetical protein